MRTATLLDQFPSRPEFDTPEDQQWDILLRTARDVCRDGRLLAEAVVLGRLDRFEAVKITKLIGQGFYPWADVVRAVERVQELAKRERVDIELLHHTLDPHEFLRDRSTE
jgi:hypothetical protein